MAARCSPRSSTAATGRGDRQGVTGYGYDALNKLTSLTTPSLPADPVVFGWDSLNRLGRIELPNGVATDLTFDSLGRPTGVTHTLGAAVQSDFGYTNDAVGKVTQMTQTRSAVSVVPTLTYGYDDEYQLTSASNPLGGADETFAYDASGNRLRRDGQTVDAIFDAANRLIEDAGFCYGYDGNGSLTEKTAKTANACTGARTTYGYDTERRMTRVDLPDATIVEYRYDGFNRRIGKAVNGVETRYVYDQADILLEYDGTNAPRARYTHGPGIDRPLMMERDLDLDGLFAATERFFYHADALGSVTALTDSTGAVVQAYVYDSFGRIALQTGTLVNPYTYTGREWDAEIGLYYYRARYYDPDTGRFLSEDLIEFTAGDTNLYRYVFNSPMVFVDPYGLYCWSPEAIGAISGAIGGGVSGVANGILSGNPYGAILGGAIGAVAGGVGGYVSASLGGTAGDIGGGLAGGGLGGVPDGAGGMAIGAGSQALENVGGSKAGSFGAALGGAIGGAISGIVFPPAILSDLPLKYKATFPGIAGLAGAAAGALAGELFTKYNDCDECGG